VGDEVDPQAEWGPQEAGSSPDSPIEAEAEDAGPALDLMGMMKPWRPACVMCADAHTKAIRSLHKMLTDAGIGPESEEMAQAMEQAMLMGEMVSRNPGMLSGFGEQVPPYIPAIRPADMQVNGNSCCLICFSTTQGSVRTNGLVAAAGTLPPGLIRG